MMAIALRSQPATSTVVVRSSGRSRTSAHRRAEQRLWLGRGLGIAIPAALIGLWQLAGSQGWIDTRIYPAPSEIVTSARKLIDDGTLWAAVRSTTSLVIKGWILGSLAGFVVGFGMGVSMIGRRALEPMLNALYVVPKLALLPLFLAMFGLADGPKLALISVTVFFFVWIQAMESFSTVADGYIEAGRSLGVSRWEMFRHVLLPSAFPEIAVSLRVSMGVAILVTVSAELVVGRTGLGFLIMNSRNLAVYAPAYVGIVTVSIIGVLLSFAVQFICRRLTPWDRTTRG